MRAGETGGIKLSGHTAIRRFRVSGGERRDRGGREDEGRRRRLIEGGPGVLPGAFGDNYVIQLFANAQRREARQRGKRRRRRRDREYTLTLINYGNGER